MENNNSAGLILSICLLILTIGVYADSSLRATDLAS